MIQQIPCWHKIKYFPVIYLALYLSRQANRKNKKMSPQYLQLQVKDFFTSAPLTRTPTVHLVWQIFVKPKCAANYYTTETEENSKLTSPWGGWTVARLQGCTPLRRNFDPTPGSARTPPSSALWSVSLRPERLKTKYRWIAWTRNSLRTGESY